MKQSEVKIIVERCWNLFLNGDEKGFFELYRNAFGVLNRAGRKWGQDPQLVLDAINEVFADVWTRKEAYNTVSDILSYLVVCVRNRLIRTPKNTANTQLVLPDFADETIVPSPESTFIQNAESEARNLELLSAIETLSRRKRELIVLRYFKGYKYEQIAQMTGLSTRTIYNKVNEAVKQLQVYCLEKSKQPNHPFYILKPSLQFILSFFC